MVQRKNETPLHCAIIKGRRDLVETLLELGADVMLASNEGSCVDLARSHNNHHLLPLLNGKRYLFQLELRSYINSKSFFDLLLLLYYLFIYYLLFF
jgi:ankyrin repeat protein